MLSNCLHEVQVNESGPTHSKPLRKLRRVPQEGQKISLLCCDMRNFRVIDWNSDKYDTSMDFEDSSSVRSLCSLKSFMACFLHVRICVKNYKTVQYIDWMITNEKIVRRGKDSRSLSKILFFTRTSLQSWSCHRCIG